MGWTRLGVSGAIDIDILWPTGEISRDSLRSSLKPRYARIQYCLDIAIRPTTRCTPQEASLWLIREGQPPLPLTLIWVFLLVVDCVVSSSTVSSVKLPLQRRSRTVCANVGWIPFAYLSRKTLWWWVRQGSPFPRWLEMCAIKYEKVSEKVKTSKNQKIPRAHTCKRKKCSI